MHSSRRGLRAGAPRAARFRAGSLRAPACGPGEALTPATGRTAKADAGLGWLTAHQNTDGGFAAAGATASNAHSTGLATETLLSTGRLGAGLKGWSSLVKLQQGCAADRAVRGAVAYDATGFDPGTGARATAQAVLGLSGTPLATLSAHGARPAVPVLACPATTR
ncbi:hypothetical protein OG871_06890 [Kitasatospora sp. NBC_00374]|uniref:hypothetical protein n=1 Tax=Kitasatospora sp. NBC_00374 TaxID=2975964 RepID=UPI0030E4E7A1